jgi:hypothetical protein
MKSKFGKRAGRKLTGLFGVLATFPFRFKEADSVPPPKFVSHSAWKPYLIQEFNRKGMRILELGSRNVTGANLRASFSEAQYIGFDYYAGENVDVVGDAHSLSKYFEGQERFDLIFSSAVFEHLHMPWLVAMEIQKLLKVGGHVFVETHFSFSSHERPWHFFQYSDMGLRALFNHSLGFDLIDSGMSNPISGYFAPNADSYLRFGALTDLYCHSEILCRKRTQVNDFSWNQVDIDGVVDGTRYPSPSELR